MICSRLVSGGTADHPCGGAHIEEVRALGVGLHRQLRAQAGHLGDDAQPIEQLAFVRRVVAHHLGDVGQHLLHKAPRFERFGRPIVANLVHGET